MTTCTLCANVSVAPGSVRAAPTGPNSLLIYSNWCDLAPWPERDPQDGSKRRLLCSQRPAESPVHSKCFMSVCGAAKLASSSCGARWGILRHLVLVRDRRRGSKSVLLPRMLSLPERRGGLPGLIQAQAQAGTGQDRCRLGGGVLQVLRAPWTAVLAPGEALSPVPAAHPVGGTVSAGSAPESGMAYAPSVCPGNE